ncbi:hypothetical protein B296_00044005 [Ensete ventricosum]|uniref:Uncharacterized protein n=1 Tax=Ensete ventricosum TaxID=4639 RepID=A0A426XQU4_ENSVE|nr:hypothetical protein B296_00044005 [Ensete ventricosum]
MTRLKCTNSKDPLESLHLALAKQVYEYSSKELMIRASKLVVWGLHFVSTLIDRVHDTGRLVQSQHEKILTFRAANKELKVGVGQELVAATEWQAKELEGEVEKIQTKLVSLRSQRRELEQEVGLLRSSLDGAQNDQARLEGDFLSLTEAVAFLEVELKDEVRRRWPPTRHPEGSVWPQEDEEGQL